MPFNAVLAPYEGVLFGAPTDEELLSFAEQYIDPDDPDRNYPLLSTTEDALAAIMPWDDGHPKHCLLSPEREIVWCEHGHGLEQTAYDKVLEAYSANSAR